MHATLFRILQQRCHIWNRHNAESDCVSFHSSVKGALGTKFELYVEALALLFGVITPSKCTKCCSCPCRRHTCTCMYMHVYIYIYITMHTHTHTHTNITI